MVRGVGYNDKGPNAEDPAITGLIAEPKIITEQGKTAVVSLTSVEMPKESNLMKWRKKAFSLISLKILHTLEMRRHVLISILWYLLQFNFILRLEWWN